MSFIIQNTTKTHISDLNKDVKDLIDRVDHSLHYITLRTQVSLATSQLADGFYVNSSGDNLLNLIDSTFIVPVKSKLISVYVNVNDGDNGEAYYTLRKATNPITMGGGGGTVMAELEIGVSHGPNDAPRLVEWTYTDMPIIEARELLSLNIKRSGGTVFGKIEILLTFERV